ncbi:Mammalian uncoordinated homology 13, subgroup, domain 2,Mammalian uncoordinated homology 13, domain 2,C2 [Cinara cedri]|uniref:Mammalian uncoordinated homology 13, subgroup, domain 2,Mammalian uncoordinated homology 13, domain 2,C2 n=1 Tax=Cinara cedri TaxID=506608 RepID=A0A5E4NBH5_9HEMI|nr:Mammalian uncoordinated homology 13, subgroup, domain 2,Mammalian uncoordinated homology 13, domain 2,C2 [Cinara cedri]
MSFFTSLHQIVTSSVANLNLSPKRFSLSKEAGADGDDPTPVPGVVPGPSSRSASTGSVSGIPRIVTPQGSGGGPRSTGPRRTGSFRQISQPRNPMAFCRRRPSWPEIDQTASSGVHETDGSFFEKYSGLQWKLDQRRLQMIKDSRQEESPPPEISVGVKPPHVSSIQPKEMEHLYMDVLYTIKHKVGNDTELSAHRDQLYIYAQKAFDITPEQHRRFMAIVHEEKPPIVVLHVTVVEAEGLEAKDANGFSDPYCMLGIQPGTVSPQAAACLPPSPANSPSPYQPPLSPRPVHANARTLSEGGIELPPDGRHEHHDKLRKHHSFRLSFKRKDRGGGSGSSSYGGREHRDSISAVPARFIQATSVHRETLNPKWGENFMFDIDDVSSDILHLDIWDHDDESSVLDAVSKLNEVRGVKGLGRFFKQIAQSARSGSQDDFLGCINIPIQDVPSTGLDKWFQLEARSQRSNIQGSIRLKLWLSTRDDHGQALSQNQFDNWTDVRRHERLLTIFNNYEMSQKKNCLWSGELCHEATSILHQHAVQGAVSELQLAVIRWLSYSHMTNIDPQFLLKQLSQLEAAWGQSLTGEEEDWLADSFNVFLDYSLQLIRKYRKLFPPYHHESMNRLEYILRCLSRLSLSKAYGKCCPFNKDIRGEIGNALRVGTHEWYEENRKCIATGQHDPETRLKGFVKLVTAVLIDLQKGIEHYNVLFENINGVFYYAAIYKQHEKLLSNDLSQEIAPICKKVKGADFGMDTLLSPTNSETGESLFELYLSVQEFIRYREHLNASDYKGLPAQCYYHWFEPALEKWMDLAKLKIVHRVQKSLEMSTVCQSDAIVKHSTSSNDMVTALCHMKEFWKHLAWPDLIQSYNFVLKLLDAMCEAVIFYAQLVHQRLKDSGFYEDSSAFKTSDEVCVVLNDLEYVWRTVASMPDDLHLETVVSAVEATGEATAEQCRADVNSLLDPVFNQYETYSMLIVSRIAIRMQAPLKKCIFHLAWSPDTLPTTDAIVPLQEYLDSHLISLNVNLIPKNFHKVLNGVWEVTIYELGHQMDGGSGDTKMSGFYERLYEALELLVEFFHAEGNGLPSEILTGDVYRAVKQRLKLHKTDTDTLIELYYEDRLMEQQRVKEANYGVLSVRAYYHHDSLCVEVLKARDVIPLDPNGFSDPFVIVELLPRSMFPYTAEQYTDVKKKTLNPLFDECFEFAVSMDQCRYESAMILFTVMDHDVITSNDFAGEAFLSLNSIPGVLEPLPHDINAIDRVDLILMHQQNKGHPILHTLEARHEDKVALDFVKKQRVRTSNS